MPLEEQNKHVFKLSPCCSNNKKLSSGYFPGVWVLKADVSKHCVCSIYKRWWSVSDSHFITCWRWNRHSVPKRRLLILRRRGNTQKTIYQNKHCHFYLPLFFVYIWHYSTKSLSLPHTFPYIFYICSIKFYDEYCKGMRSQSYTTYVISFHWTALDKKNSEDITSTRPKPVTCETWIWVL